LRASEPLPPAHPSRWLYFLILLMVLFWSMNFIIGKAALREFPALLLAGLRISLAGLLLLPAFAWDHRNETGLREWRWRDLLNLTGLGVIGVTLNQLFFVVGLSLTSVAHASILMGLTPMVVLLVGALTGAERITGRKLAGLAIALTGVAVLNRSRPAGANPALLGDLFIFLSSLAFAIFTVAGKRVTRRYRTITVNTFAYVAGAVVLLPVTLWQSGEFAFSGASWAGWAGLFYMAAFPSVICYLIFYYALTQIPASKVAAFGYLQPLLATLLAVPLLGESITAGTVVGGSLVFSGICLAERA